MIPSFLKERLHPNYFWVILSLGFSLNLLQGTALNSVLSVFIKPMTEELGWGRSTISGVATVGAFASGPVGLAVGRIMDRRGVRLLAVPGILVMGGCLASLGFVGEVWSFYLLNSLARVSSLGVISVAVTVVMSNWFVRQRGRAVGMAQFGARIGGALLPLLAAYIAAIQGWRFAWIVLGLMVLALAVPVSVYLRHRPEDLGLLPDGLGVSGRDAAGSSIRRAMHVEAEPAWTAASAARTPTLWLLGFTAMLSYLVMGGVNMHQVPYMTDMGIPAGAAVGTLAVSSASAAFGGLAFGMMAERVHIRYVLAAALVLGISGMMLLVSVDSLAKAYAYAMVGGAAIGGTVALSGMVWAEYFGRRSVGAIQGLIMPLQLSGNALGPFIAGWAFDVSGSYTQVFALFGAGYVVAAICALLARPVQRGKGLGFPANGGPCHHHAPT